MTSRVIKKPPHLLISGFSLFASVLSAQTFAANATDDEIAALKARIAALETNPLNSANWRWSGALQIDASYTDDYYDNSQSDIQVSKALLGIATTLQPDLVAAITILYEEDETDLELDEVYLSYGINDNLALTAGQIYLPFGRYKSAALVDPLTLELGEIRETAAMIAYEKNELNLRFYVFNGDTDVNGDVIDNFGWRFGYDIKNDHGEGAFSLDFINNLIDSNRLQDLPVNYNEHEEGIAIAFRWDAGTWGAFGEYLGAMTNLPATILSTNGGKTKPRVIHGELFFNDQLLNYNVTYAAGIEQSKDALALGFPRLRLFASIAVPVTNVIVASAEIINDRDYDSGNTSGGMSGTGDNAHSLVFQLAGKF